MDQEDIAASSFINFLKRRKAYVYIDLQHYDEAESLLKKMLDDPDNTDFAIGELAYLQKLKGDGK
jgi:Tfp pilus assembly protein FimV